MQKNYFRQPFSIILLVLLAAVFALISCANMQGLKDWWNSGDASKILLEEAIDTAGYTLGLMAAENPAFRKKIEGYYKEVVSQGLTAAIVNNALLELKAEGVAYQVLAYKLSRIVKLAGGSFDPEGNLTDFGAITAEMLEIGKQGYLLALQNTGAV